jgi:hypothetical protein
MVIARHPQPSRGIPGKLPSSFLQRDPSAFARDDDVMILLLALPD